MQTNENKNELVDDLGDEAEAFSPEELAELNSANDTQPIEGEGDTSTQESGTEPKAEAQEEPQAQDQNRVDMVPHQALHAERLKTREYKAQLDDHAASLRQINETIAANKLAQQQEIERQQQPDPENDPLGFGQWKSEQLENRINQFEEKATAEQQQQAQQREVDTQWGKYIHERNTEAAKIPDFEGAFTYLANGLKNQLLQEGCPPEQLAQEATNREWEQAQTAYKMGISPAQQLYFLAQQHGYKSATHDSAQNPTEQAAADASAKLDKINKAQTDNVSLSQTGGAGSGELTLKDLAAMTGAELERLADTNPDQLARLTG